MGVKSKCYANLFHWTFPVLHWTFPRQVYKLILSEYRGIMAMLISQMESEPKSLYINDSLMVHMNQNKIKYEIVLQLLRGTSHGRQLSKDLKVPLTTIQRSLKELESENAVDFDIEGKNKVYMLRKNIIAKKYVLSAENYKLLKLLQAYPDLEPIINGIAGKSSSSLAVLFGSYAKFSASKGSDIDLYVEGRNEEEKQILEAISSKVNVKLGRFDLKSLLIKEIILNHVIIKGVEEFYGRTGFFEKIE